LKGFLGDFVESEHSEGDKDFTKIPQYNKTSLDDGITTETAVTPFYNTVEFL